MCPTCCVEFEYFNRIILYSQICPDLNVTDWRNDAVTIEGEYEQ